ncbi:latexin isoform X2 [Astyanax mexicanus]|uniref:Latexin n=1 Tax=Astyanax mexicanus TaxID=7994 RepID=A0A8T2MCD2_ASTMX|nr:latexin isoform X2 [Astyanax mexicanus]KAG9278531.1 latexin [Astyanax mexicanus]
MNWFCFVWTVLFSMVWQCPAAPSTPSPTAPGSTAQDEVECPSNCVLLIYSNRSTSEDPLVMTSTELNPDHYEAQRAAHAVRYYLNTLYGTPFRQLSFSKVHQARTEDLGEAGMKYLLEISVKDSLNKSSEKLCSAEVVYPRGETQQPPKVQISCAASLQLNTSAEEEDFYKRYSAADSAVSGKDIPDSYGHVDPEMVPFWKLAGVASTFIMLNESNENTLYNLAQVAKITQLESQNGQLRLEYVVLLHDMISQEIIRWKMLVSWSPAEGVKVSDTQLLPKCHCKPPTP